MPSPTRHLSGPEAAVPAVSVVVPLRTAAALARLLAAMEKDQGSPPYEVVVVGDAVALAQVSFAVRPVAVAASAGPGAAINAGVAAARAPLVLILSDIVDLAPGSLAACVAAAAAHPATALFQPKVRAAEAPTRFDYAGAAGGLVDRLGYPFAYGRLFDAVEDDRGQHDDVGEIFWACAAVLVRRDAFCALGGLDESFGGGLDELDFAWRLQLAGGTVRALPGAVAFRAAPGKRDAELGATARNYRNSLVVLLKNLAPSALPGTLAARLALDLGTLLYGLLRRDWRTPLACLLGFLWTLVGFPRALARRRDALRTRTVPFAAVAARLYPRSVAVQRFVRGLATVADLPDGPARLAPAAVRLPTAGAAATPVVSIIVPTWNEVANVAPLCARLSRALADLPHEILFVDDGSPDGTAELVERLGRAAYPRVRVLRRCGARGLSAAVLDGFAAARGRLLAVMDADLQHDPHALPALVAAAERADLVVGSRYTFRGGCRGWSLLRRWQSRLAAGLTRQALGLPVRDPLSGFFVVRAEVFGRVRPQLSSVGWKILLEFLAADSDLRVAEVPITFRPRRRGASKMNLAVLRAWLAALVRLRRARPVMVRPAPAALAWSAVA